eukprot:7346898-Prymnesium_polylepis.2
MKHTLSLPPVATCEEGWIYFGRLRFNSRTMHGTYMRLYDPTLIEKEASLQVGDLISQTAGEPTLGATEWLHSPRSKGSASPQISPTGIANPTKYNDAALQRARASSSKVTFGREASGEAHVGSRKMRAWSRYPVAE